GTGARLRGRLRRTVARTPAGRDPPQRQRLPPRVPVPGRLPARPRDAVPRGAGAAPDPAGRYHRTRDHGAGHAAWVRVRGHGEGPVARTRPAEPARRRTRPPVPVRALQPVHADDLPAHALRAHRLTRVTRTAPDHPRPPARSRVRPPRSRRPWSAPHRSPPNRSPRPGRDRGAP